MSSKIKSITIVLLSLLCVYCATKTVKAATEGVQEDWRLAVGAYSFRKFTFFESVDKTAAMGLRYIESFDWQPVSKDIPQKMSSGLSDDVIADIKEKLNSAGVRLVSHYVGSIPSDEAKCRKIFEFGRKIGLENFTSEPKPEAFDTIEKLCDEYGITVSIHNHPRPKSRYWNPQDVVKVCQGRSNRIGACADTGHWQRSGIMPVEGIKTLEGRLISLHVKDIDRFGGPGHDVPWGTGQGKFDDLFAELKRQNFKGLFIIEYESHPENPTTDIQKCVAYFTKKASELGVATASIEAKNKDLDISKLKDILSRAAAYDYGESREPITELTDLTRSFYDCPPTLEKIEKHLIEFLRSDAALAAKQYICKELSIIGTAQSVPVLAEMLTDTKTSDMARYALERISGPEVDKALRDALDRTSGASKIGIINSLGERGDREAVEQLGSLLQASDYAGAAATALGKISGGKAAAALKEQLKKTSGKARSVMADAYLMCADKFLKDGDKDSAMQIYNQLYAVKEPVQVRIASMRGMIATADEKKSIEIVVDNLKNTDQQMQAAALSFVNNIPGSQMTKALADELPNLSAERKVQMLSVLASRGDCAALPAVVNATKSTDDTVRIGALSALAGLGNSSTVSLLANVAATTEGAEHQAARDSLYRLRGTDIDKKILASVPSADPKVKVELIRSINERNICSAVPVLLDSAKDQNDEVRLESIKVLGGIAGPEDGPALVDFLVNAKNATERKEAEKTVVSASRKSVGKNPVTSAVLAACGSVKDTTTCCSLLSILGKIGDNDALGLVQQALKDTNADVRDSAIRVLSDWPNDAPASTVIELARSESKEVHRLLALRGYIRMAGLPSHRPADETVKMYKTAMDTAKRNEERKLVLAGVSKILIPDALSVVEPYLEDDQLRAEAKTAYLAIAMGIREKYPAQSQAALAKIQQASSAEPIVVKPGGEAIIDAVNGILMPPMQLMSDENGVSHIVVPPQRKDVTEDQKGKAIYTFSTSQKGMLNLSFYINCRSAAEDSWYIKLDDTDEVEWNHQGTKGWQWKKFQQKYPVKKGEHTLTVRQREAGAKMSKIKLTLK